MILSPFVQVCLRRNSQYLLDSRTSAKRFPSVIRHTIRFNSASLKDTSNISNDTLNALVNLLPIQYLRDIDPSLYDETTGQRKVVLVDSKNGKPLVNDKIDTSLSSIKSCFLENDHYHIIWKDGLRSTYSVHFINEASRRWKQCSSINDRVYWSGLDEQMVRSSSLLNINFKELITSTEGQSSALRTLYLYGILLVTDTPVDDNGAGVAALASAFGGGSIKNNTSVLHQYKLGGTEIMLPHGTDGPLRTLYGTVWSTEVTQQAEGASIADSAYGNDGLPLHTDMTYHRDPPGLQIFTMKHPSSKGGENIFGDGFAAADRLRRTNPEAFSLLSSTTRSYRSIDVYTGWHLQAHGPIISLLNGQISMIRHNDLDRLPDLPSPNEKDVDSFYDKLRAADEAWTRMLAEDEHRLVISLQQGDTMVVANQRCLHGRLSFLDSSTSPRAIMGCYVSQDELSSRFRMEGFVC